MEAAKDWSWEQDDKAEELLGNWIEEQAERLHPNCSLAERIVRDSLILLLENEAIAKVKETHPDWEDYLPEILSPREAAMMIAMEQPYDTTKDVEAATDLLSQMQDGSLQPSKELLGEIAQKQK
jgi:hypothetical protein